MRVWDQWRLYRRYRKALWHRTWLLTREKWKGEVLWAVVLTICVGVVLPIYALIQRDWNAAMSEIGPSIILMLLALIFAALGILAVNMLRAPAQIYWEQAALIEKLTRARRSVSEALDHFDKLRTLRMSDDEFVAAYKGRKADLRTAIHQAYSLGRLKEFDTLCHRIESVTIGVIGNGDTWQSVHEEAIAELVPSVRRIIKEEESRD